MARTHSENKYVKSVWSYVNSSFIAKRHWDRVELVHVLSWFTFCPSLETTNLNDIYGPWWCALVLSVWPMGHQHLEARRSWRRVKKLQKTPVWGGMRNSVIVCDRAVRLDQWIASMWKNDTRGLCVWGKKRQKPPIVWWKTCLSTSENPLEVEEYDHCSVSSHDQAGGSLVLVRRDNMHWFWWGVAAHDAAE